MFVGLKVSAPVDTDDAAILSVSMIRGDGYCPAVIASVTGSGDSRMVYDDVGWRLVTGGGKMRVNVIKK